MAAGASPTGLPRGGCGSSSSSRSSAPWGTRSSPPLLLAYRCPFLLVSLEGGRVKIPLLAGTEAPELQKTVCSTPGTSPVSLQVWFRVEIDSLSWDVFQVPFPAASAPFTVRDTPEVVSASWRAQLSLAGGQDRSVLLLLTKSEEFLRCLSLYLCYHTGFQRRLSVSRSELVFAGGCCHAAPQEAPVAAGGFALVRSQMRLFPRQPSWPMCTVRWHRYKLFTPRC